MTISITKTILTIAFVLTLAPAMTFSAPADAGASKGTNKLSSSSSAMPGGLKNPTATSQDFYCKDGSPKYVPCDEFFIAYCKLKGGTMSGVHGWGGRSCWEPS